MDKCECKTREIEVTAEDLLAAKIQSEYPIGSKEQVLYDLDLSIKSIKKCIGEPCFWIGAIQNAIDYINKGE